MEKTLVFIDDGYLSQISKHFGNGKYIRIDINQFAITLAKRENLWVDNVYLYTARGKADPDKIRNIIISKL